MRITLGQVRQSRLPQVIGKQQNDLPGIAAYVNQAQEQLIKAGGESGWWGGWQKVQFQMTRCNPYATLPRNIARLINLDVCRFPVRVQNEFYEFLEAGIGLQDFCKCKDWCGAIEGFERGTFPSMVDIATTNQTLTVFLTDPRDIGKRILIGPALDQNSNPIYTQDGQNSVNGFYMTLASPFTNNGFIVTQFTGVQKDATFGDVLLYQQDATTGAQVLLSRYGPDEINPAYRRYFVNNLPCGCGTMAIPGNPCVPGAPNPNGIVTLTAMAKLEYIPVNRDTDFLIIGSIPALIEECKAIRYGDMDTPTAPALETKAHAKAIRYLNEELIHYLGRQQPAINVAPFGTATLERQMIGTLI